MQLIRLTESLDRAGIGYRKDEPMAAHTTFGIGGAADLFLAPGSPELMRVALTAAKEAEVPVFLLGNGSNLLVSDRGIEGAVISTAGLKDISRNKTALTAGAGVKLASLCLAARDAGLAGLEFAYGIPGTVGGALFMNAGAYGGEMKDVVRSAEVLTAASELLTRAASEMALGYRTSCFKTNGDIILSVTVSLTPDDPAAITARMQDYMARRRDKQPLEYKSAGSTFKRPAGHYAGTLIEECGLKGTHIGDAEVSEKHAGFIINKGNATAAEVSALIERVQKTVSERTGVLLEPEVIAVGRF